MDFLTVSQLNAYLKNIIENNDALKRVTIKGEISNFTNHLKTGHFYFTLKDSKSSIKAIMFNSYASKVPFKVENGQQVIVTGSIKVFERDGIYQIYCSKLEPDGIGAFYLAFEQTKKKLSSMGYFDEQHKKPIPPFPKKIAVITAKTGAVLQDIRNILTRRYPLATIVLVQSLVQGENAVKSICDGLDKVEEIHDIDVVILARGGGTIEDLWCFNSEVLANRIYRFTKPIISAVGHETDFTICDFVSDKRAATPSEAAEFAATDIQQLKKYISDCKYTLDMQINNKINSNMVALKSTYSRLNNSSPNKKIERETQKYEFMKEKLNRAIERLYKDKKQKSINNISKLEALSPLKVLIRGYSIAYADDKDKIIKSVDDVNKGDIIKTRLNDGIVVSKIIDKE